MRCYRYFKECRNCLVHGSGLADEKAVKAYAEFSSVSTPADLDVKEVPTHEAPVLGNPIKLHLRGVVGFSDIVMRIVSTLDAELSRSIKAEKHLKSQWMKRHGRRYSVKTKDSVARSKQIQRLMKRLDLPMPKRTIELEQWLRAQQLVS